MAGKYYSGADGTKLLVLDDDENRAKIVMSYDAKPKLGEATSLIRR